MKDAVGSSVLFYIILIFLGLFIVFIAFIMQYATAYRASNYVVTMLERTEGKIAIGNIRNSNANSKDLTGFLKERLYYGELNVTCKNIVSGNNGEIKSSVFKVTTVINFDLPLIEVHLPIHINNETKAIYNVPCSQTRYEENIEYSNK